MTRNRLNMVLAVIGMVVVAVGGFFLGVQPQLARAAADDTQQSTVQQENALKSVELARLRKQAKTLPEMQAELGRLEASVPSATKMSAFYDEIGQAASAAGVTVSAITTSDAVAYTPPVSEPTTPSATGTPTPTPTPTPEPVASASASAPPVATDASITASNFSVVPVTVSVDGSFDQALSFVGRAQALQRLYLVNSITSSASDPSLESTQTSSTTWNFSGYVFVLDTDATAPTSK
ncbi:type 4a pilus biogenesis protein PilO [Curtobacterium sp. MCLR17_032]|uniref:type 4a pilus biogenesis protein PilO n=1 Tax=Curtobacterium sp. MCLR17_032 TaxID=2175650 RepID=UPI000DAA2200|nr:type 4a pilus biogenesis protein PilO [Curtobacterium sp. MCLR17_032]WIE61238.1 type 4a pilus biogenesis protein PilO [Curtobacterium sp. MCLR17_032]